MAGFGQKIHKKRGLLNEVVVRIELASDIPYKVRGQSQADLPRQNHPLIQLIHAEHSRLLARFGSGASPDFLLVSSVNSECKLQ